MSFESVRGYLQLASGLGDLTRARAMEAAQGLLSLQGVGMATGKLAVQAGALAEELLAAATSNREHLTTLVRTEVDAAVTRLGLVSAETLKASRAETARLRAEVAALRSATKEPTAEKSAATGTAKKAAVRKSAATGTAKKAAVRKSAAAGKSAVTTRRKPVGT